MHDHAEDRVESPTEYGHSRKQINRIPAEFMP